jgi:hypothetical protein
MDSNDKQAIENLFDRLAQVERQSPPRDADAEAYIRDSIARQPGAPYYMAQTIVALEQALAAAQARIEEFEAQSTRTSRPSTGGLLDGLFGSRQPTRPGAVPLVGRSGAAAPEQTGMSRGGGFLAGAAQTAIGVAGGLLLGNALAGMLEGDKGESAHAESAQDHAASQEPELGEAGFSNDGDFDVDI